METVRADDMDRRWNNLHAAGDGGQPREFSKGFRQKIKCQHHDVSAVTA